MQQQKAGVLLSIHVCKTNMVKKATQCIHVHPQRSLSPLTQGLKLKVTQRICIHAGADFTCTPNAAADIP